MRLYLINPSNEAVSLVNVQANPFNKWRVWKPLGLLYLAARTPPQWQVTVIDENLGAPDYASLPAPDLVGLTAFTAQAPRAYQLAAMFRQRGVPVVMGGIHATMRPQEAARHVDAVVRGEAEEIWPTVLADAAAGRMRARYEGGQVDITRLPAARHDLLSGGYKFGSLQTTRGCPLNCSFCCVSQVNGTRYRQRPVADVVQEMQAIPEKMLLIVDDNLIGTSASHMERAKELFRAMIAARVRKRWVAQVTINMADDDELMRLARAAGCFGVFIGFESTSEEGLVEVNKRFNLRGNRDFMSSSRRLQRRGIAIIGSFILGLDLDRPGAGVRIAQSAVDTGVDLMNLLFLTPFPGTRLWDQLEAAGRIADDNFPEDWRHYTLNLPVVHHPQLSAPMLCREFLEAMRGFYSLPRIIARIAGVLRRTGNPLTALIVAVASVNFRNNIALDQRNFEKFAARREVPRRQLPARPPELAAPLSPV